LYLKQLIIGGYDKVFEIGKQFRNEGIDKTHNPEFTTCELYQSYSDYNKLMTLTEEMFEFIIQQINQKNENKEEIEIFNNFNTSPSEEGQSFIFKTPFKRLSFVDELEKSLELEKNTLHENIENEGCFFFYNIQTTRNDNYT
jgi:lysyl-tRNA synthetase class 2